MPYDRLIRLQLAADELPETRPADLPALGFIGLSPSYWKELKLAPDVIKTVVAEEWEERINTVSSALLGLTVACARCHDHKFDPISQKDYYALAGVFASTRLCSRPLLPTEEAKRVTVARERVKELEAEAKRLSELPPGDAAKAAEAKQKVDAIQAQVAEIRRSTPGFDAPTAYAAEAASLAVLPDGPDRTRLDWRPGSGQDVPMQLRGNPGKPGPVVPRGFLAVLSGGKPVRFTQGSGRRELADAIFREGAPLAARVIVNRIWKHYFGRAIVETPSNFGLQGDRPSHPELLDDLAARFIRNGWSLKWLHRQILLSATYQQATAVAPAAPTTTRRETLIQNGPKARSGSMSNPRGIRPRQRGWLTDAGKARTSAALRATGAIADPDNVFLSRMSRRRLEVEAWRDAILSATGQLDPRAGGPAEELSSPKNLRRTLYGTVRRRELDDLLRLYDFPDPTAHSPARFHTTTPLQQLYVLNSDFIRRQATALAERVKKEVPGDLESQVARAYLLLYSRPPSASELEAARKFFSSTEPGSTADAVWIDFAEVLLARSELMFVD
jgi:hypothetical protein